ncbi:ABC transporter permease [Aestuariispira insulae]|uniref:Putative ABC transport system permease protein n=1 Tax=Aestuariispira insulae TaxID=1461337 RepID=A0A3D9HQ28_9PROT|nr:ABC transporter permease [Aestuariispira insulae]RED51582.1 putative ABC transport system permease protein [Aestuariispira insulae]
MTDYIQLGYLDLLPAALLVIFNAGLSILMQLGLLRVLAVSVIRMVIQLSLIGLILTWLFDSANPVFILGIALVMLLLAGREAWARQDKKFSGIWGYGIGTGAMLMAASLATAVGLGSAIRPDPWYMPQYAIPMLGMILGNCLTGISLGLDTLTATALRERQAIESRLALGQPRLIALSGVTRQAMRTGMMPIINSMAATGIISLPGMMTGQILAGVEPMQAIQYQMLIMFLIFGGTGLGVITAVGLGILRLTDQRHRLRLDRLQ